MKFILICSLLCFSALSGAQKLAVEGYITPTYGNIVYKSNLYCPVFAIGGGLAVNYYKNRWMFNTGLNYKNAKGGQDIPMLLPAGNSIAQSILSIKILTVPLGVSFLILKNDKYRLFGGLSIENGLVLQQHILKNTFGQRMEVEVFNQYYMGIMPKVGFDYKLSERKLLFVNAGCLFQSPSQSKTKYGQYFFNGYEYGLNNLFVDVGYGFMLKN